MSADNPTYHAVDSDNPNHRVGCLLCRVTREVTDPATREMAFMAVADMSKVSGSSWQDYTNACRMHAMRSVQAITALNAVFVGIMKEGPVPAPEELVSMTERLLRKQVCQIEEAVIARYDRRTE